MNHPYIIDGGSLQQERSQVRVLRGRTLFEISVQHSAVEGTIFSEEYSSATRNHEGDRLMDRSRRGFHCIASHCLPVMQQLATETSILGLPLEDLVQSRSYALDITRDGQSEHIFVCGSDAFSIAPAFDISTIAVASMPASCASVPQIPADSVIVGVDSDVGGPQGQVVVPGGQILHFKPRENGREREFDRELLILIQIQRQTLSDSQLKLPELHGIVVSGALCIGFLINRIETSSKGADLMCPENWTRSALHPRWEKQVKATVNALHTHGIVWGDVNAGNVVIDRHDDAWVIDFGGGNNPWFVDDDKVETMEGDLQGVRRLFQEWLSKRRDGVPF